MTNLHQAGKIHNLHQVCGISCCVGSKSGTFERKTLLKIGEDPDCMLSDREKYLDRVIRDPAGIKIRCTPDHYQDNFLNFSSGRGRDEFSFLYKYSNI